MRQNSIILKSISFFLIGVFVYMHVCSAWCAIGAGNPCCKGEGTAKSCCSHHKGDHGKTKGCQDFHLSFFKATGQFVSEKNVDVDFVFPIFPADLSNLSPIIATSGEKALAFNNYHPPPPIPDIRIYIQSFQI